MNLLAVSFWCSGGSTRAWTWSYTPYVGVWIVALGLVSWYVSAHRRAAHRGVDVRSSARRHAWAFGLGVLVLIASSEWPLGPLGAGYLASAAMLRYLLISLVAVPLLLLGTPLWLQRHLLRTHRRAVVWRALTRWPIAFVIFNGVGVATNMPWLVDRLKVTQFGSFALDAAWFAAAVVMWWPVLSKVEEAPRLPDPARSAYLLGQSLLPTIPASFLTFSDFPLYRIYELAPPVWLGFDKLQDQQIAGLLMKIGGGFLLWTVIAVLFFRWSSREERWDRPPEPVAPQRSGPA